jgi:Flp pilus assembly protein TadD
MKSFLNVMSIVIIVVIGTIFAFRTHVVLGIAVILLLIGFSIYRARSNFYAVRANAAFSKGELEQSLHLFKKAYDSKPCPENHQISYCYILLRAGNTEEAEKILKQLEKTTKSRDIRIQAKCNLATTYWLQGNKEQCMTLLEEVFDEIKNTLIYGNFGYFKLLNGDPEAALVFNLEAYAYNADDKTIVDNLALNYYFLGQIEQAEGIFKKLMLLSPKFAEPHYYYALTLNQLGKTEEAIEQLQQALGKELAFITPISREEIKQVAVEWNVDIAE